MRRSTEISQHELRNNSGDIMRRLDEGESFIVTRSGVPIGELSRLRRRRFVSGSALAAAMRGSERIDYVQFRADLELYADQNIEPRA